MERGRKSTPKEGLKDTAMLFLSFLPFASPESPTPGIVRHEPMQAGSTGGQGIVLCRVSQCSESGLSPAQGRGLNNAPESSIIINEDTSLLEKMFSFPKGIKDIGQPVI